MLGMVDRDDHKLIKAKFGPGQRPVDVAKEVLEYCADTPLDEFKWVYEFLAKVWDCSDAVSAIWYQQLQQDSMCSCGCPMREHRALQTGDWWSMIVCPTDEK
jgi:hypothetical protein